MEIKKKRLSLEAIFAIITAVFAFGYCFAMIFSYSLYCSIYIINYGDFLFDNMQYATRYIVPVFTEVVHLSVLAELMTDTFIAFALYFIFKSFGKDRKWLLGLGAFLFALVNFAELFMVRGNAYYSVIDSILDEYQMVFSLWGLYACAILMLHGFGVLKKSIFPLISTAVLTAVVPCWLLISMIKFKDFANLERFFADDPVHTVYAVSIIFEHLAEFFYYIALLAFVIVLLLYFVKTMRAENDEKKKELISTIKIVNDSADEKEAEKTEALEQEAENIEIEVI